MAIRTGADYIKALRHGREIWHGGRRIEDVTTHAGFTGTIKTLADLCDRQHSPERKDMMTKNIEASASPFGKRGQRYEPLQSGEVDRMRQRLYGQFKDQSPAKRILRFVREPGDGRR